MPATPPAASSPAVNSSESPGRKKPIEQPALGEEDQHDPDQPEGADQVLGIEEAAHDRRRYGPFLCAACTGRRARRVVRCDRDHTTATWVAELRPPWARTAS